MAQGALSSSDNRTTDGIPHSRPRSFRKESTVKFIADHFGAIVTGLGLIIYASVRLGYQTFYQQFDLTPESVGITYLSMVAPAAVYLALLLLFTALWVGPFFFPSSGG
jgi:hypothetical protein